ncbi:MFS transporter [Archangium violaceum]|uniref:MFS transporter n=1 Tax=Archangium violaceum TaxID=83451 RepID=UPI00193C407F|nr:MFS transporter [Archangium violaceum]QRK10460.1 MFS transporter [Archangium violaceum]
MAATRRGALSLDLWRERTWRRWVLTALFARLPGTMTAFALLMAGREATGSFTFGAWMASACSVGAALAAPWRGRMLDREPLLTGLRRGLYWQALLTVGLCAAATLRAPAPVLLAGALLLGVMPSGVQGGIRALLASVAPASRLEAAFALDAVLVEVQWVLGPLLVGMASASGVPLLALGLMGMSALAASVLSQGLPERPLSPVPASVVTREGPGVWRTPGVLAVLVLVTVLGVSWGALEAGVPPRLEEVGVGAAQWGVLAALLSAVSAVGGLVYTLLPGARGRAEGTWRAKLMLGLWGLLLLPLGWMASLQGLGLWLVAAGLFLAPLTGTLTFLLQRTLPPARHAEGFSFYSACWSLGVAGGGALAGSLLAQGGARPVLAGAALLPLAVVVLLAGGAGLGRLPVTEKP